MALAPKVENIPKIRGALKFYKVTSVITGLMLLALVVMMVFRYGYLVDIEFLGPQGLLALTPREMIVGINLSIVILTVHGWFYVVYLVADFRLWSFMRWPFGIFLLIAAGGVVPFLSFIVEHFMHRRATRELQALEAKAATAQSPVEASH